MIKRYGLKEIVSLNLVILLRMPSFKKGEYEVGEECYYCVWLQTNLLFGYKLRPRIPWNEPTIYLNGQGLIYVYGIVVVWTQS